MNRQEIAQIIDHTNLKPDLKRKDLITLLDEAKKYSFKAVCVTPAWVYMAKQRLVGTGIEVSTVPNWSSGGGLERIKGEYVFEEADAIDYILDIYQFGVMKAYDKTAKELEQIRLKTRGELKIIIESTVLRSIAEHKKEKYEDIMKEVCKLVEASGANWIKTDSGLFLRDPKFKIQNLYEDVSMMDQFTKLPIKAAGGIGKYEEIIALKARGADRIGTSRGVAIVESIKETA